MGSNVLPQALLLVPRYCYQCQSNNLSFSTTISPRFSSFSSNPRVSLRAFGSNSSPIVAELAKRSFVVRAESSSDSTENVEDKEDVVDEEETEMEAEVKSEEEEEEEEAKVKTPRKPRIKLGDIMGILNKRAIEASEKERPVPDIRTGDVVEIKLEVPENRRRASTYKGIVISKQNAGIHTTIRIRRIIAGIGVEIVFPVYSPNIKELKVVSHRKVRRARLYYLRDKLPRLSTFK